MALNLRKTLTIVSTFGSNVIMKISSISHSYLNTPYFSDFQYLAHKLRINKTKALNMTKEKRWKSLSMHLKWHRISLMQLPTN